MSDTYFGEVIEDPYQWMEDSNDPQLKDWLDEQAKLTKRQSRRQTHYWDLRAQIAAMYRIRREKTEDHVELDPKFENKFNTKIDWNPYTGSMDFLYKLKEHKNWKKLIKGKDILKSGEEHVLYGSTSINEDENLIALAISVNGSDWAEGHVYDLTTGSKFPYTLENIRTGTNFEWNGRDLYYTGYKKPKVGRELLDKPTGEALYRLSLKELNARPELIYKNPDTTGTNSFTYDIHQKNLKLYHPIFSRGTWYKAISIADLDKKQFQPRNFLVYPSKNNIELSIAHIKGDSLFLKTTIGAPNGKLLLANLNKPNELSDFIPEYDLNLQYVNKLGKNKLACVYRKEGQNIALIFNLNGELLRKINFPKGKKLNHFYENNDEAKITNFSISSFFHPNTWYQLNLENLEFKPSESISVPYDINNLETRYVTYTSKDGTNIDMYITCEKNTVLDGSNPVLIYAYGGYGTTVEPSFDKATGLLLAHGGILAVPNVRGGGAKGSDWAVAGRRLQKQKAIDDFIAAGEYLIKNNYTTSEKLVISGGSHGALLVEASAIQCPELFKAVIAEAGPYDMLRFNLFTIGSVDTNLKEFGTPENIEDYKNLKSYSPLHNIARNKRYPNTLLVTGDTDDRVPPHHSFKFLAKLQELGDPSGLYHLYVTPGSGHYGALAPEDYVDKLLYEYYFMFEQMGIEL
ncbi:prolyl oligopeptidase family serine peptidase [Christiangramia sp.]|uniref:prolyl oligopeptidase family serine peptidase n=1 Tax=Christiangramia sp. TaxID=1931228 RepID=UPI00260EF2D1|nr:prolyl oligopeptidase family serine peptidase [Christiangramia sp.]